mgnify:CR=1 FL=1
MDWGAGAVDSKMARIVRGNRAVPYNGAIMKPIIYTRGQALPGILEQRIAILDGAMGTMIQRFKLTEADYRGARFHDYDRQLAGYYGVTGGDSMQSMQRSDGTASGLLTLPAFLAMYWLAPRLFQTKLWSKKLAEVTAFCATLLAPTESVARNRTVCEPTG